jgi:eukaryotic-like serine/threonine-protein kinase
MANEPIDLDALPGDRDLCGIVLLGRYKILERLGKGGMGTVYLAEHVAIGKKFALKVLSAEYSHRADLVQRFLQEARAASMIAQQNVVEISDFGDTPDGSVFFVMEYLSGEDLAGTLKREKRLPWARVRHMMLQVCRALEAAHAAGIIHRDMKPDNCFRITRGSDPDFIKVLDFGIAKVQSADNEGGKGLTRTGMVFGTPEYMAPEQAEGTTPDHRIDVYAVGVIMYELLCGRVPFVGKSFMGILTKHLFEIPEAPTSVAPDAEIPPEAEAIVLKALQKDANLRFADMAEMIAAIEAVGTGAAAVEVVAENIARPSKGPTGFAGQPRGQTSAPELHPHAQAGSGSRRWIGGLVGAGLLAAAVVGGLFAFSNRGATQGDAAEPAEVAAAPEPEPAIVSAPPEQPEPEQAAPVATPIKLQIHANVPVQILDGRDRAIYGNSSEGIELEQSSDPVSLILVAEGYEELAVEVIPNRDGKRFEFELQKLGKTSKATGGKAAKGTPTSTSAPEPTPAPEPKPPPPRPEGDLKNPFGR